MNAVEAEGDVPLDLGKSDRSGTPRTRDSKIGAMQLLSQLESEFLQRVLPGIVSSVDPEALPSALRWTLLRET